MENFLRVTLCVAAAFQLVNGEITSLGELKYQMRDVQSIDEFVEKFIRNADGSATNLTDISHIETEEGRGVYSGTIEQVSLAQFDNCSPRLVNYEFPENDDQNVLYFPRCTQINQCGGCGSSDLVECRPTQTQIVELKALALRYDEGTGSLNKIGYKRFQVEEHQACSTQCLVQVTDCDSVKQTYEEDECRCVCKDSLTCPEIKILSPLTCECACRVQVFCGEDSVYNDDTCSCDPVAPITEPSTTTTSTTTTTHAPRRPPHPCAEHVNCPTSWRATRLNNGRCSCAPPGRYILSGR